MRRPELLMDAIARATPPMDGLAARRARRRARIGGAVIALTLAVGFSLLWGLAA